MSSKDEDLSLGERIFGKKKTMKERAREWQRQLKREQRGIQRQINQIEREEVKTKRKIKETAKKNSDKSLIMPMAKELVVTRKEKKRLHMAMAQIGSSANSLKAQFATMQVASAMTKTSEVMKAMNALIKIPELRATLKAMSQEMYKSGIIEEMTDDAFSAMEPDNIDELAGNEIDSVLQDILGEQFAGVGAVSTRAPELAKPEPKAKPAEADGEEGKTALDAEEAMLSERLKSL
jgi:charged multivesicular body protein 3